MSNTGRERDQFKKVEQHMRRRVPRYAKNLRFGLTYTGLTLVGSVIYRWLAGPLFGDLNAAAVAFMVLVLGVFAVAGAVAFVRQPDPFSRSYFRYEFMDVPDVLRGKLDSGPVDWLWQAVPMVVMAVLLLPFFA
jgi:hypothetical protein